MALQDAAEPLLWRDFAAPATWTAIDFISDLHLSADTPRTFDAFADYLRRTCADAVFILGDLFEVWLGDDARHEGFEATCTALLAEAASRRFVAFMVGNRDFLLGPDMLAACGITGLSDPTVLRAYGTSMLLSHGDALCLSDESYQRFRAIVRSDTWKRDFLSRPLAGRHQMAFEIRDESRRRKKLQGAIDWVDIDPLEAVRWMRASGASGLIHGHTHSGRSEALGDGSMRHVLSDWDLDTPDNAPRAEVLRWRETGLARIAPADAGTVG